MSKKNHLKHSEYDYKPNPHKNWEWKSVLNIVKKMVEQKRQYIENGVEKLHVFLSPSNAKGAAPSVSTIPVHDCSKNCMGCARKCYDVCHVCIHKETRKTRARNSAIFEADPERFFNEVSCYCKMLTAFRWHVGGDIKSMYYFEGMVRVANENPHCKFHIFTKSYDIVNEWIDKNGSLPSNFSLRFSEWPGVEMKNPHGLNVCRVQMKDEFIEYNENVALCTGNCTDCEIHGSGCFNNNIKTVVIPEH